MAVERKRSATIRKPRTAGTSRRPEVSDGLIQERAYFIWEQRGRPQGTELENWLQAKAEIQTRNRSQSEADPAEE